MKILLLLFLIITSTCFAREYYVDSKADFSGDGSFISPFMTIQEAADIMKACDICFIRSGIYNETVIPAMSGTIERPIIFKPSGYGDKVILAGYDPLPARSWEKVSPNLFRTKIDMQLGHENQIFLGNRMLVEARWPNIGHDILLPALSIMSERTTPDRIVDNELPDLDWKGARVWIHAPKYWADWTTKITDFGQGFFNIDNIAPYRPPKQHVAVAGAKYFIYGCISALDADNEWYFNSETGFLYVYRTNSKLPKESYYVKRRFLAFDLSGKSNIHVREIEVRGATIVTDQYSSGILLDGLKIFFPYHSGEAHPEYGNQTDKGVLILGSNCTVQNCEIA